MDHTKTVTSVLDYPPQELSVHGLRFVVTLLVCWQINCVCVCLQGKQSISKKRCHKFVANTPLKFALFIHSSFDMQAFVVLLQCSRQKYTKHVNVEDNRFQFYQQKTYVKV